LMANHNEVRDIADIYRSWPQPWPLFRLVALGFFVAFSYAVGAVAWSLVSAARWIAALSRDQSLRIQPGHSDGCCGLRAIGNCCLQSAVPLLIGMVLCLIWSNSPHLRFFTQHYGAYVPAGVVPFSYSMIVILFVLACALVFLPVRGLHERLEALQESKGARI
jgi:hypothetical protein